MNTIDLTKNGGFPFTQNALNFLQNSYTELFEAIARCYGNKTIVTGMEVGGSSVAEGWLVYNGEFIKFNDCALDTKVNINTTLTSVEFEDGLTKAVYYVKTASCGATGAFNFNELQRAVPFNESLKTVYDNTWLAGDIKMISCDNGYIATNFDSTGLGRLERLGWAICNGENGTANMRGRVPVGFDSNTINPADNVWDADYNRMGSVGGEKKHQLSEAELAEHQHDTLEGNIYRKNNFSQDDVPTVFFSDGNPLSASTTNFTGAFKTGKTGGNQAHENRQPFIVTLFIQKL